MTPERRQEIKQIVINDPVSLTDAFAIEWMNKTIETFPAGSVIFETGTFVGGTTRKLAMAHPDKTVHTVEITWQGFDYPGLKRFKNKYNITEDIDLYDLQSMHLEDLDNVYRYIGTCFNVNIDNISVAFIDSDHHYDWVIKEFEYVWERLNPGGYIFFDDYVYSEVNRAVDYFVDKHGITNKKVLFNNVGRIQKVL